MKKLLLSLLLIVPLTLLAQNQGDDLGLGQGGNPIIARVNEAGTNLASGDGKANYFAVDRAGKLYVANVVPGTSATSLGKADNVAFASGETGVGALAVRDDLNALVTTTNGRHQPLITDNLNGLKVAIAQRSTMTHTQPTVTNATSFTLVAANTSRRYLEIQNNSAANIMINLNNGTLTGIVPTSINLGIVLPAGATWKSPANLIPTAAVTCYQSSGTSINTISVVEG